MAIQVFRYLAHRPGWSQLEVIWRARSAIVLSDRRELYRSAHPHVMRHLHDNRQTVAVGVSCASSLGLPTSSPWGRTAVNCSFLACSVEGYTDQRSPVRTVVSGKCQRHA